MISSEPIRFFRYKKAIFPKGVFFLKGIFYLVLIIGIVPVLLGIPWGKMINAKYSFAFAYSFGYFFVLALFHLITFAAAFTYTPFHYVTIIFSVLLGIVCIGSLVFCVRKRYVLRICIRQVWKKMTWLEYILLFTFIAVVGFQLVQGYRLDLSYMSYDDAIYTVMAADALETDSIATVLAWTGEGTTLFVQRAIQTSLFFPTYLASISGISIPTIEHTFHYIQLIILAYMTYIYMAGELTDNRENQLMFLLFIAVFFIFGYHSHYSLSFRLLGPNYQGKAIVAVSLSPLVLLVLCKALSLPYNWKTGLILLILSLAATSLTLWGIGTIIVIVVLPVLISLFRKARDWKHLLYIAWACIMPAVFLGVFVMYKYLV